MIHIYYLDNIDHFLLLKSTTVDQKVSFMPSGWAVFAVKIR